MPGIVALRDAISADVVSSLATANYPPLVDGKILLGRQAQFEQSAPPRIIFTPVKSDFPMKDTYNRSPKPGPYTLEQLAQLDNPSILSDQITFEVECWGSSLSNDPNVSPDDDYDMTQTLYHQVIRTCDKLARGSFTCSGGSWVDARFASSQIVRDGRAFTFSLTFGTPILLFLQPLASPTPPVLVQETDTLVLPTGQSGPGCS